MKQNEIITLVITKLIRDKEIHEIELYRLHDKSNIYNTNELLDLIDREIQHISEINQKIMTYQNYFQKPQEA
jgi:hypothetical protein